MPLRLKKTSLTIFQRFFRTETLGGLILLGFGLAALTIANSPLSEAYNHLWEIPAAGIFDNYAGLWGKVGFDVGVGAADIAGRDG